MKVRQRNRLAKTIMVKAEQIRILEQSRVKLGENIQLSWAVIFHSLNNASVYSFFFIRVRHKWRSQIITSAMD